MHLIAFRHDLTGYQHIYPEQGEGSSWWALLNLTPGPWHVIVVFAAGRTGSRDQPWPPTSRERRLSARAVAAGG